MRLFVLPFSITIKSLLSICLLFELTNGCEKGMLHGLAGRDAAILVVDEHFVEQVEAVLGDARIIVLVHVVLQGHLVSVLDQLRQLLWHIELVSAHVLQQVGSSHGLNNLHELVIVV